MVEDKSKRKPVSGIKTVVLKILYYRLEKNDSIQNLMVRRPLDWLIALMVDENTAEYQEIKSDLADGIVQKSTVQSWYPSCSNLYFL
jgi:hypothetical protein